MTSLMNASSLPQPVAFRPEDSSREAPWILTCRLFSTPWSSPRAPTAASRSASCWSPVERIACIADPSPSRSAWPGFATSAQLSAASGRRRCPRRRPQRRSASRPRGPSSNGSFDRLRRAVGIHHVDLFVPVADGREGDLGSVGRPGRQEIVSGVGRPVRLHRAVRVHDDDVEAAADQPRECDPGSVGRPGRLEVMDAAIRQVRLPEPSAFMT